MTLLMLLDEEANRAPQISGREATNAQDLWERLGDPTCESMTNTYKERILQAAMPEGYASEQGCSDGRQSEINGRPSQMNAVSSMLTAHSHRSTHAQSGSHRKALALRKARIRNKAKNGTPFFTKEFSSDGDGQEDVKEDIIQRTTTSDSVASMSYRSSSTTKKSWLEKRFTDNSIVEDPDEDEEDELPGVTLKNSLAGQLTQLNLNGKLDLREADILQLSPPKIGLNGCEQGELKKLVVGTQQLDGQSQKFNCCPSDARRIQVRSLENAAHGLLVRPLTRASANEALVDTYCVGQC